MILILAVALILMKGIDALLARLGIQPEDPASAKSGASDIVRAVRGWFAKRRP